MTSHPFGIIPAGVVGKPEPFELHVPEEDLKRFKTLLEYSRIGPETWESKQEKFGVTREWLINAKKTWLSSFDWREQEKRINSVPNFKININDKTGQYNIHFAALFSKKQDAIPILFMHGWPGSFIEFLPTLSLLAAKYTPETLPYHVIVPSLPGYTLSSGGPLDQDFLLADCARIMNQLMIDLGFGKKGYVAQGGDVGSLVSRVLSPSYDECKAIHLNMFMYDPTKDPPQHEKDLSAEERQQMQKNEEWRATGTGYAQEHGTRPATIGAALSASPLSLLAWIGEKFLEWADSREPIKLEDILLNVTLYWLTDSFPRSIWVYRGLFNRREFPSITGKPLGYSKFPAEIGAIPKIWAHNIYPNISYYEHKKGGHFAALEQPEALLADVEDFVAKNRGLFDG